MAPQLVAMVVRKFSESGGLELYAHKLVEGLLAHQYRVTVVCEESDSALKHSNLKIETFVPPPTKASKSAKIDHYFKVASQRVNELGPFDIVHSQHFPVHGANVVTFHNHTIFKSRRTGFAWESLLNYAKSSFVPAYLSRSKADLILMSETSVRLFPSQICREDFIACYGAGARLRGQTSLVVYPGAPGSSIPTELGKPRRFPKGGQMTFLFVGRGYRRKGLDVLLRSCQLLKSQGKNFQLLIAGLKAKPWDQLRLKCLGIDKEVQYLGFCRDMAEVYAGADAIVMPSRLEPFGMAPLEAMSFGLIPIVTRSCGVAEVLSHETDALIVNNHLNARELSHQMERLMTDEQLFENLSKRAIVTARQQEWEKTVSVTRQGYDLAYASKQASSLKQSKS
jgi:glycosyltransferase involved in cell wall biosynthesis